MSATSNNLNTKVWTWRDSGNHGPLLKIFNFASDIVGYSRKRFVAEQLMEQAADKSGLSDFGDPGFREGLDLICRCYNEDFYKTGLAQLAGRAMLTAALVNRLQVIDWYKKHPEVQNEIIDRPWVITGLPRTGTTLGSYLFDLDARVRSPLVWEAEFPIPPAQIASRHSDERIARSAKNLDQFRKLVPPLNAIHPFEANHPQECLMITQMDFQALGFHSIAFAEDYLKWYAVSDKHAAYRTHKQLLQIWQAAIPTLHWGLKTPMHMHGIVDFIDTYPDARMIWSHRDPLVAVPSVISLQLAFLKPFTRHIDVPAAARSINQFWLTGIQRMTAYEKAQPNRDWCCHSYYRDMISDPVESMRSIYRHFGDEIDALHERKIKTWVDQRPKNVFGIHQYSLEDFGLDAKTMREQYAEYTESYNVPHEHKI